MTAQSQDAPWWGRIELLWFLAVPLCGILYTLSLPLLPNDFWFHARAGAIIAATGHIPTTNIFASGIPADAPYIYQNWLAEWIFYQVLRHGGLAWTIVLRSVCIGATWTLLVAVAYRRCLRQTGASSLTAARCAALAGLAGFLMAAANIEARPQLFSLPLFAIFVAALWEWPYLPPRLLRVMPLCLAALMILWVNLHGAFFTGLLVLTCYLTVEFLLRRKPECGLIPTLCDGTNIRLKSGLQASPSVPLRGHQIRNLIHQLGMNSRSHQGLLVTCACCFAGTLVNPLGIGIYPYLWRMSSNPIIRHFVTEWQPPSWGEWHNALFFLSPLLPLLSLLLARKRSSATIGFVANPPEWTILLVLGLLAVQSVRAIAFYAMAFVPLTASILACAMPPAPTEASPQRPNRALHSVNAFLALALCAGMVPLLPWFKAQLSWPPAFRQRFAPTPRGPFPSGFETDPELLLDRGTPVEAVAYIANHPLGVASSAPTARLLFCDMEYGSYLGWELYPRMLPGADPRIEMYPAPFWLDYFSLCRGPRDSGQILRSRGYGIALLDRSKEAGLARQLEHDPSWVRVFQGRAGDSSLLFYAK